MATINLEIDGTRLRVAVPRALVRPLRKIVKDYIVQDDLPLGFVMRPDGRPGRRFVLVDRCGFRLGAAHGRSAAISLLVQHLAAFRHPPSDTVQFRVRTLVHRGGATLCLYPVLYTPPVDERSLTDAGYRLVHRLDTWIQACPPRARIVGEQAAFELIRSREPLGKTQEVPISALAVPDALHDSRAARSVALVAGSVGGPRREIFEVATNLAANVPALAIDLSSPLGPQLSRGQERTPPQHRG